MTNYSYLPLFKVITLVRKAEGSKFAAADQEFRLYLITISESEKYSFIIFTKF